MKNLSSEELSNLSIKELDNYYYNQSRIKNFNPNFISEYFGKENADLLKKDLLSFDFDSFAPYNEKVFSILWSIKSRGINENELCDFLENTTAAVKFLYELNMRMGNKINYLEEEIEKLKTK